jgi:hypothetical protein
MNGKEPAVRRSRHGAHVSVVRRSLTQCVPRSRPSPPTIRRCPTTPSPKNSSSRHVPCENTARPARVVRPDGWGRDSLKFWTARPGALITSALDVHLGEVRPRPKAVFPPGCASPSRMAGLVNASTASTLGWAKTVKLGWAVTPAPPTDGVNDAVAVYFHNKRLHQHLSSSGVGMAARHCH